MAGSAMRLGFSVGQLSGIRILLQLLLWPGGQPSFLENHGGSCTAVRKNTRYFRADSLQHFDDSTTSQALLCPTGDTQPTGRSKEQAFLHAGAAAFEFALGEDASDFHPPSFQRDTPPGF